MASLKPLNIFLIAYLGPHLSCISQVLFPYITGKMHVVLAFMFVFLCLYLHIWINYVWSVSWYKYLVLVFLGYIFCSLVAVSYCGPLKSVIAVESLVGNASAVCWVAQRKKWARRKVWGHVGNNLGDVGLHPPRGSQCSQEGEVVCKEGLL